MSVVQIRSQLTPQTQSQLTRSQRIVPNNLIAPARSDAPTNLIVEDHTADPIKSLDDIARVSEYLLSQERYRDNMLFILGINFGLRVSDLIELRFDSIINPDMTFKDTFAVYEIKTRNTRKVAKNRYITICDSVVDAVITYLQHSPRQVSLDDYIFSSESNHGSLTGHLNRKSVDRILKGIADDLNITAKISTHSLRKTFGYQIMLRSNNDPRQLLVLSKMFGHSSVAQTLSYIGITKEEIATTYRDLNLGLSTHFISDLVIAESTVA